MDGSACFVGPPFFFLLLLQFVVFCGGRCRGSSCGCGCGCTCRGWCCCRKMIEPLCEWKWLRCACASGGVSSFSVSVCGRQKLFPPTKNDGKRSTAAGQEPPRIKDESSTHYFTQPLHCGHHGDGIDDRSMWPAILEMTISMHFAPIRLLLP